MTTTTKALAIAVGETGYSRWDDPLAGTKYGRWYAQKSGSPYFGTSGVAFCNMFVSWCLAQAGVPEPAPGFFAHVPTAIKGYAKEARRIWDISEAKPGDLACFDWDGDGEADHIGFVEINKGAYFQTVEGNTGNGVVARRTRHTSDVCAVLRPYYRSESRPARKYPSHWLAPGDKGPRVTALQSILKRVFPGWYTGKIDGIYGPITKGAVAKLQAAHGVSADGIMGSKTLPLLEKHGYWLPPTTARSKYPAEWAVYTDKGEKVKTLQARLLKTMPGLCAHATADGDFGLWTLTSISRLQQAFGIYPDGMAGPTTNALLDRLEKNK